jgi:hypothetical protein
MVDMADEAYPVSRGLLIEYYMHLLMRTSILWLQLFLPLRYLALSLDHEHNN